MPAKATDIIDAFALPAIVPPSIEVVHLIFILNGNAGSEASFVPIDLPVLDHDGVEASGQGVRGSAEHQLGLLLATGRPELDRLGAVRCHRESFRSGRDGSPAPVVDGGVLVLLALCLEVRDVGGVEVVGGEELVLSVVGADG